MIEPLPDLPDGVIGFAAAGELTGEDFANVLAPAVKDQLAAGNDLRLVLVFERWDGISGGALWEDLKMGVDTLSHWRRTALVTDIDWMTEVANLFGWMSPGELKHFPLAERHAAIEWVSG